jgi:hypothetical protein
LPSTPPTQPLERYLLALAWHRPLRTYIVLKYGCTITSPGHHLTVGDLIKVSAPLRGWTEILDWVHVDRWFDPPWLKP